MALQPGFWATITPAPTRFAAPRFTVPEMTELLMGLSGLAAMLRNLEYWMAFATTAVTLRNETKTTPMMAAATTTSVSVIPALFFPATGIRRFRFTESPWPGAQPRVLGHKKSTPRGRVLSM